MKKLAITGGSPAVRSPLVPYQSIGPRERKAVESVLDSGCLSRFVGAWGNDFDGGDAVKALENAWRERFGTSHAVSVNSATSGLFAAVGAAGVGPGDEVIVPPYTMSATAMAPLVYGGIPVFADIEPDTFCIDVADVARNITPHTKAIIAVNLFGHPARLKDLRALADKHGICLIEDNAQGPLARENGKYCGTIGHIGVFSLNYHKHIHSGEGGICVTDDEQLALRLRIIRNHGENVVLPAQVEDLTNLIGFNYRLTELSAAVALAQLQGADEHVECRVELAEQLTKGAQGLSGVTPPVVRSGCSHVYYVWAMRYDADVVGVSRTTFSKALFAEGFPNYEGYVKPLYLLPIFQKRIAIGSNGFPFNLSDRQYAPGLCPVVERMHERELLWFPICANQPSAQLAEALVEALRKVHAGREELRRWQDQYAAQGGAALDAAASRR